MTQPFLIIKYYVSSVLPDMGRATEYAKIYAMYGVACHKTLTRQEATDIIRENGLIEVLSNKYGKVWADSKETFKYKYAGVLHIPRELCATSGKQR